MNNNLFLFFTRGVSLKDWVDKGLFDREVALYNRYLDLGIYRRVYFITYHHKDKNLLESLKNSGRINDNIYVISIPRMLNFKLGWFIYSFISFLYLPKITNNKSINIYKSNQLNGAWSAYIASYLRKGFFLLRTGFTKSIFLEKQNSNRFKVKLYKLIECTLIRKSDLTIVASHEDKVYLENLTGKVDRIKVNHNYIDLDKFKKYGLNRMNRVLFVGRLTKQKNLPNVIKAVTASGLGLDIIGDGELKEELIDLVSNNESDINFLGVKSNDELSIIYGDYRYFILGSLYEGMPKVLLEAMASQCVCIGTNVAGINEVIVDSETGFLSDTCSVNDLIACISNAKSSCSQEKISNNGRELIARKFSLESHLKNEVEYIEYVTSKAK